MDMLTTLYFPILTLLSNFAVEFSMQVRSCFIELKVANFDNECTYWCDKKRLFEEEIVPSRPASIWEHATIIFGTMRVIIQFGLHITLFCWIWNWRFLLHKIVWYLAIFRWGCIWNDEVATVFQTIQFTEMS